MEKIIEIKELNKYYGKLHAVKDLSFSVNEGELFAFLGVNGAGKSTTINIICNTLSKDSGKIIINGQDIDRKPDSVKHDIGVVFQTSVLDKSLSVIENLRSRGALYSLFGKSLETRINEVSELLDFKDLLNRKVGKLSGGQKRRIDIARALLHKPKILILDEPTTGLDPQTRTLLWKVVTDLQKKERLTVLLTTHYMEEAAEADNVVIINAGELVARGTPNELKNIYAKDILTLYGVSDKTLEEAGYTFERAQDGYRIRVDSASEALKIIQSLGIEDFEFVKGRMDDVFLAATGIKTEEVEE